MSMNFILLINVKMQINVVILTFRIRKNTSESFKAKTSLFKFLRAVEIMENISLPRAWLTENHHVFPYMGYASREMF